MKCNINTSNSVVQWLLRETCERKVTGSNLTGRIAAKFAQNNTMTCDFDRDGRALAIGGLLRKKSFFLGFFCLYLCRVSGFAECLCRIGLCRDPFAECGTRQNLCRVQMWLCRVSTSDFLFYYMTLKKFSC